MQYQTEQYQEELEVLNQTIWDAAEVLYQEKISARTLADCLEKHGFQVEHGVGGLPTAFKAVYGKEGPSIGLLAEYDALDGLSQKAGLFYKECRAETTHGHGCGHNLLGTAVVAAALVVKDYLDKEQCPGKIVVYGCPAEEGGSGKTYMARAGAFEDIDVALTWHPSTINASMGCRTLANIQAAFRFKGKASHAAIAPEAGRSALDAVELMDVGCNFLREHMGMTDRVHYAIRDTGGVSPNVVQSQAEVLYLVRSERNESAKELFDRVVDIARGAALMTETEMEMQVESAVSDTIPNEVLGKLAYEVMVQLKPPAYSEEECEYIHRLHELVGEGAVLNDDGAVPHYDMENRRKLVMEHPMADFILPYKLVQQVQQGSTDMGDVSQKVPLIQVQTACFAQGTPPHSWMWVTQGTSSYAIKGMLFAGQIMADMAKRLLTDHGLLAQAKEDFYRKKGKRQYICPIPKEVSPNFAE